MLEIVGIEVAAFHYLIGLYIIVKHCHLQIIALVRKNWLCLLQKLCMWRCGSRHLDYLVIGALSAAAAKNTHSQSTC